MELNKRLSQKLISNQPELVEGYFEAEMDFVRIAIGAT